MDIDDIIKSVKNNYPHYPIKRPIFINIPNGELLNIVWNYSKEFPRTSANATNLYKKEAE